MNYKKSVGKWDKLTFLKGLKVKVKPHAVEVYGYKTSLQIKVEK